MGWFGFNLLLNVECLQGSSSVVASLEVSSAAVQGLGNLVCVERMGFLLPWLDFVSVSAAVPNPRIFNLNAGLSC